MCGIVLVEASAIDEFQEQGAKCQDMAAALAGLTVILAQLADSEDVVDRKLQIDEKIEGLLLPLSR